MKKKTEPRGRQGPSVTESWARAQLDDESGTDNALLPSARQIESVCVYAPRLRSERLYCGVLSSAERERESPFGMSGRHAAPKVFRKRILGTRKRYIIRSTKASPRGWGSRWARRGLRYLYTLSFGSAPDSIRLSIRGPLRACITLS